MTFKRHFAVSIVIHLSIILVIGWNALHSEPKSRDVELKQPPTIQVSVPTPPAIKSANEQAAKPDQRRAELESTDQVARSQHREYQAVAGSIAKPTESLDVNSTSELESKPTIERKEPALAAAESQPNPLQQALRERLDQVREAKPNIVEQGTRKFATRQFGNSRINIDRGEVTPAFVISNLDIQQITELVQAGKLLSFASVGDRQFCFTGPIEAPTSVFLAPNLSGFSSRGLQTSTTAVQACWKLLLERYHFPQQKRSEAVFSFLLSEDLDSQILAAQREAATRANMALKEVRCTYGGLVGERGNWRFVIDRIE